MAVMARQFARLDDLRGYDPRHMRVKVSDVPANHLNVGYSRESPND
jgi:hypothetical protein